MKSSQKITPQFITDNKGNKLSVIIPVIEYAQILEDLEELEDIRLYDIVKAKKEKSISFDKYLQQRQLKKKHA
jgi:hypothetical protein